MDWGYKAVLTMVSVALVLLVAQMFGRRAAGTLAGLPIITAPALLWMASEHGAAFAARCAVGSIAACGLMALFALVYERVSRRCGPFMTLAASLCAAATVAIPISAWAASPVRAILFAIACCGLVATLLPAARGAGVTPSSSRRNPIFYTATVAGVVSLVVAFAAHALGPFWAGLLASLPVIAGASLVNQHLTATHADIQRFLRGYVAGLLGKAMFAVTFALLVVQIGVAGTLAMALAVGLATSVGAARSLVWLDRRPQLMRA